jgi:hypothetical protein
LESSQVEFSPEAIETLKKVRVGRDSLGDIDCFKADDGMVVFSFLGGPWSMIDPAESEAARGTDFSLVTATEGVEVPEDFKQAIDGE